MRTNLSLKALLSIRRVFWPVMAWLALFPFQAIAPVAAARSPQANAAAGPNAVFKFAPGQKVFVDALKVDVKSPDDALLTVDDVDSWSAAHKEFKKKKVFEVVPRAKNPDFIYLTICAGKKCDDRFAMVVLPEDYNQFVIEKKFENRLGVFGKYAVDGYQVNMKELFARSLWSTDAQLNNKKRMAIGMATMNILNVRNNASRNVVDDFHKEIAEAGWIAPRPAPAIQAGRGPMPLPPGRVVTLRGTGLSVLVPESANGWSAHVVQAKVAGGPEQDELEWAAGLAGEQPFISVLLQTGTCEALQQGTLDSLKGSVSPVDHPAYLPNSIPSPVLRHVGVIQACKPVSGGLLRLLFAEPDVYFSPGTPEYQNAVAVMKAMLDAVAQAAEKSK